MENNKKLVVITGYYIHSFNSIIGASSGIGAATAQMISS